MVSEIKLENMKNRVREIYVARMDDPELGPFKLLPGTWSNLPSLPGRGWNMIALPFATRPGSPLDYRLLLNQFNEELKFTLVDKMVPNRGIGGGGTVETDQFVVALDYEQMVTQIAVADFPASGLTPPSPAAIHHEPGLFLHMLNEAIDGLDIGRLGTIPHGDSLLALGKSVPVADGPPTIPPINGLPIGVSHDLNSRYLAPYQHFNQNLFQGVFNPVTPEKLLIGAVPGNVLKTTTLEFDSSLPTGGVINIPFVVKQANASAMKSTFWIQELAEKDAKGNPRLIIQYAQVVLLEFFDRRDGSPGRIQWPHVSINTLEKVAEPSRMKPELPAMK